MTVGPKAATGTGKAAHATTCCIHKEKVPRERMKTLPQGSETMRHTWFVFLSHTMWDLKSCGYQTAGYDLLSVVPVSNHRNHRGSTHLAGAEQVRQISDEKKV